MVEEEIFVRIKEGNRLGSSMDLDKPSAQQLTARANKSLIPPPVGVLGMTKEPCVVHKQVG